MSLTATTPGATGRQVDYIRDLAAKRSTWQTFMQVGDLVAEAETVFDVLGNVGNPDPKFISRREASAAIDALLRVRPDAPTAPRSDVPAGELAALLAAVPLSRYALPRVADPEVLDFFEVVERKNHRRYLNRLLGCPGDWRREHLDTRLQALAARHIGEDPVAAARAYSLHFTRCARCEAPLSDPRSRACGFGHDCAQHYGVKW